MSVRQFRMNIACQFCKNSKVYCRCQDCEIFLCSQCDYVEHSPHLSSPAPDSTNQPAKHKRIRICDECEEQECATQCLDCAQFMCKQCNKRLHQRGTRRDHRRQSVQLSPELRKPNKAQSSCSSAGKRNSRDMENEPPRNNSTEYEHFTEPALVNQHDTKLNYSHSYLYQDRKQNYYSKNADYQERQGHYQALGKQGRAPHQRGGKSGCYSSGGSSTGSNHNQYQNYRGQDYHYSTTRGPNKFKKGNAIGAGGQGGTGQQGTLDTIPPQYFDGDQIVIPIWQPFVKCEESSSEMIVVQKELFSLAQNGHLLIEYDHFCGVVSDKLHIQEHETSKLLDLAEAYGIIHQTKRNFAKMKTLSFISLQLEIITHECVTWILTSLRKDEMTPTDKAVQSRIKEAFAIKIEPSLWQCILESLTNKDMTSATQQSRKVSILPSDVSSKTSRNNQAKTFDDYYSVSKHAHKRPQQIQINFVYPDKKGLDPPEFKVSEIEEDPSIHQMTKAIYLKDETEWVGVDYSTSDIDFDLYEELKSFLYTYFCQNLDNDEEEKWCSSIENALTRNTNNSALATKNNGGAQNYQEIDFNDIRAIPGGRYGCAQFVKICGPTILRNQSLGRLTQLVQYAVDEDVLRYHKTLLVWTTTVDPHKKFAEQMQKETRQNATIQAKMNIVKQVMIEILAESKSQGMSLAQIPNSLKRKLPFPLDYNELGFSNLKNLILTMSDKIKLELRGHNHPFAYLVTSGRYVHAASNSDDFQNIPKNNRIIMSGHQNLSEDVNTGRYLKNALAMNEVKIKQVLEAFYNMMRESPMGVRSDELPRALTQRLGFKFNYKNLGCQSLLEFLKKFVIPTNDIEIISSGQSQEGAIFTIRSRQFFLDYMNQYQQQNMIIPQQMLPMNRESGEPQDERQRQTSPGSSLNISANCYVPKPQSLYGGSVSVNTSQHLNVSHIRYNTADTDIVTNQLQQIHQQQMAQKPPLAPSQYQQQHSQQHLGSKQPTQQNKTYPPPQLQMYGQQQQQQQQQLQQQQFIRHQQSPSNMTNLSGQSIGFSQPTGHVNIQGRGFFLSPSHLQFNKTKDPFAMVQNSPIHSRAISDGNSAFGGVGPGGMQSTTSKSASQDFSIQSQFMPNSQPFKGLHYPTSSGFASPPNTYIGGPFLHGALHPQKVESQSIFSSPNPRGSMYDASSMRQFNYNYECSPPYMDQEEDDSEHHHQQFQYIEKLVCDDDIDFKSGDEYSSMSMHSPTLSTCGASGLKVPTSSMLDHGPGFKANKPKWQQDFMGGGPTTTQAPSGASKGLLTSSSSANKFRTLIMEGNVSSSEGTKRPSTVQEQKTEEDEGDNSVYGSNLRLSSSGTHWQNAESEQQESASESGLWTPDTKLF